MSGGSFDYIYTKRYEELLMRLHLVDAMSDAISDLQPSSKAARDTEQIRLLLLQASALLNQADGLLDIGLADVWKEVEWFHNNDVSRDDVVKAVVHYGQRRN